MPSKKLTRQMNPVGKGGRRSGRRVVRPTVARRATRSFLIVLSVIISLAIAFEVLRTFFPGVLTHKRSEATAAGFEFFA